MLENRWLAIAFLCLGVTSANAVNMINNANFEGDLGGWSVNSYDGSSWETTGATFKSGARSAINAGNSVLTTALWHINTNDITEASFWLKQEDTNYPNLVFIRYTDGTMTTPIIFNSTKDWTKITLSLEPNKVLASFGIGGNQAGAGATNPVVYIDDVTFDSAVVPEPATIAALAVGIAAFRRRRK